MNLKVAVTKTFAEFRLDVHFMLENGITILFGPSGAGKSVTLKLIAGLLTPDAGEIELNGQRFFTHEAGLNVSPQRRNIGYVFQNHALFPHMTVWENVLYGAKRFTSKQRQRMVEELLNTCRLTDQRHKYPHEISGGEQQRAALARAIIGQPQMLLLDEPFSDLDSNTKRDMHNFIKSIHAVYNIPMIFVTHDILEAYALGRQMLVMVCGRIIQQGSVEQILRAPLNPLVAGLMQLDPSEELLAAMGYIKDTEH